MRRRLLLLLLLFLKIKSLRRAARCYQVAIERRTPLIVLCDTALLVARSLAICLYFGPFVDANEAKAPPTDNRKPRPRRSHGRVLFFFCSMPDNSVEPLRRRKSIEPGHRTTVLFRVHQNVDDRIAHLSRRSKCVRVIALAPKFSANAENFVHPSCDANREPLHAARPSARIRGLHDQMQMIGLHGKVKHTKLTTRRPLQSITNPLK